MDSSETSNVRTGESGGDIDRGIYPDALAERLKKRAGEKYQPTSGEEGEIFMSRYCNCCKHEAEFRADLGIGCPIAAAAMAFDVKDDEYPWDWQYGEDGQPTCTTFEEKE